MISNNNLVQMLPVMQNKDIASKLYDKRSLKALHVNSNLFIYHFANMFIAAMFKYLEEVWE